MRHFFRKLSFSKDNSFIRLVALSAAGSGLAYKLDTEDSDRSIRVSIPAVLHCTLSSPWAMPGSMTKPSFSSLGPSGCGSPLSYSSASSDSAADVSKEPPFKEAKESPKPCCGCLGRDTIANAAARVGPAVVNLSVPKGFHGMTVGKSIGSGTIIDDDGTILTCAHVVVDFQGFTSSSKGKVDVTLQDGRSFEGTVVNADLHSDIAIVKINSKTPLPTAKLGSSHSLRPGDWVVAVGCPLSLQNTITAGIVSCVDRKSSDLGLGGMRREYLQTDCAINAGNSGGPLVNIDGEVIGVNIMKVLAADGLSFSVPIDSASKIIEHFKTNGRVVRPWLGLKMLDLNDMIVAQLKEKDVMFPDVSKGVLVPMVTPGSPAERAGFRPGDVVVEFEQRPVGSIKEVRRGADRADIYSLAFSTTSERLAVSSDRGTVHVFNLKVDSGPTGIERSHNPSEQNNATPPVVSHLSFMKGVLPKYFSSEWSVARVHLNEGLQYVVGFGHQKNTVVILGMDGSFYRCEFNPVSGGEMTVVECHNFLKPGETFS